jgi:hypothetical protein
MRYETPQLIGDSSATDAIQHVGEPVNEKGLQQVSDATIDPTRFCTIGAYEADE